MYTQFGQKRKTYISYQARFNRTFASENYVCYEKAIFFNNFEVCINNFSYDQSTQINEV